MNKKISYTYMRKFKDTKKKRQRKGRATSTKKQRAGSTTEQDIVMARRLFGPPVEDFAIGTEINIRKNRITKLWSVTDPTGRSLANTMYTEISCVTNKLTALPTLPASLEDLDCGNNSLTQLPDLPNSLTELECYNNRLTQLPNLPNGLTRLYCSNNQLTQLPDLPNGLEDLECNNNRLTQLPNLPNGLTELNCDNNQLTQLPDLPNGLENLECNNNQLTQLPNLPNGLKYLDCRNNHLTQLPDLPNNLNYLLCDNNQLTQLPTLPNKLGKLRLSFDQAELLNNIEVNEKIKIIVVDSSSKMGIDKLGQHNKKWRELLNRGIKIEFKTPKSKSSLQDRTSFDIATMNRQQVEGSNANMNNAPDVMLGEIKSYLGGLHKRRRTKTKKYKK